MNNTYIDSFVVTIVTILEAAEELIARIEHVVVLLSPGNEAYQHEEEKVVHHLQFKEIIKHKTAQRLANTWLVSSFWSYICRCLHIRSRDDELLSYLTHDGPHLLLVTSLFSHFLQFVTVRRVWNSDRAKTIWNERTLIWSHWFFAAYFKSTSDIIRLINSFAIPEIFWLNFTKGFLTNSPQYKNITNFILAVPWGAKWWNEVRNLEM